MEYYVDGLLYRGYMGASISSKTIGSAPAVLVVLGLGRIVALHNRSFTSCQIRFWLTDNRHLY